MGCLALGFDVLSVSILFVTSYFMLCNGLEVEKALLYNFISRSVAVRAAYSRHGDCLWLCAGHSRRGV